MSSLRRGIFVVFATFSFLSLVVTSIWAWRSMSEESQAHPSAVAMSAAFVPSGGFGTIGDFSFTERGGRQVAKKDLLGKVWIANFIFTNCPGVCPRLSGEMAKLQKELVKTKVQLVSFTVDPDRDTTTRLQEYADKFEADKERWLFLTGEKESLHQFIQESFRLAVGESGDKKNVLAMDITHSGKFVLLGRDAKIVGFFDAEDPASLERLRAKAAALDRE